MLTYLVHSQIIWVVMNGGQKCPLWFVQGMKLKISYVLAFSYTNSAMLRLFLHFLIFLSFFYTIRKKEEKKKRRRRRRKRWKDELEDVGWNQNVNLSKSMSLTSEKRWWSLRMQRGAGCVGAKRWSSSGYWWSRMVLQIVNSLKDSAPDIMPFVKVNSVD